MTMVTAETLLAERLEIERIIDDDSTDTGRYADNARHGWAHRLKQLEPERERLLLELARLAERSGNEQKKQSLCVLVLDEFGPPYPEPVLTILQALATESPPQYARKPAFMLLERDPDRAAKVAIARGDSLGLDLAVSLGGRRHAGASVLLRNALGTLPGLASGIIPALADCDPQALPEIAGLMAHPSSAWRLAAMITTIRFREPQPIIERALGDSAPEVRDFGIRRAVREPPAYWLPHVTRCLKHPFAGTASTAAWAMRHASGSDLAPTASKALFDFIARAPKKGLPEAFESLKELKVGHLSEHPLALSALKTILERPPTRPPLGPVVWEALRALRDVRALVMVYPLVSGHPTVRAEHIDFVVSGPPGAQLISFLEILEDLVEPDAEAPEVTKVARGILTRLDIYFRRAPPVEHFSNLLSSISVAEFEHANGSEYDYFEQLFEKRAAVAIKLMSFAPKRAFDIARKAILDTDPYTRLAGLRILHKLKAPELPESLERLASDPNPRVAKLARSIASQGR
jgi:hypothetical protein